MKKISLLFVGQGSQFFNMGHEIYEEYDYVREMFSIANDILGYRLEDIIFTPSELLNQTKYTQAAVLVTSCCLYEVFKRNTNQNINMMTGFSLGEYTALYAAGIFTFHEIVELVKYRSIFMDEASQNKNQAMAAILGLEIEKINELISQYNNVFIANINTTEQIVVGGLKDELDNFISDSLKKGAKRGIFLNVSGAFHTPLMSEASRQFKCVLDAYNPQLPTTKIFTNYNGDALKDVNQLKELMVKQIHSPVLFLKTLNKMKDDTDLFIEIGPGKVLSGFVRRIDKTKQIINIENLNDILSLKNKEEL